MPRSPSGDIDMSIILGLFTLVVLEDSAILMDLHVLEDALDLDVEPVATDMDLDLL